MFDTAAHLAKLYKKLGDTVTPAAGDPFLAIFSAADIEPFGGAGHAGDYQIRYALADASLAVGSALTIRGQQYRVVEDPSRMLDGLEAVVRLVEHA